MIQSTSFEDVEIVLDDDGGVRHRPALQTFQSFHICAVQAGRRFINEYQCVAGFVSDFPECDEFHVATRRRIGVEGLSGFR